MCILNSVHLLRLLNRPGPLSFVILAYTVALMQANFIIRLFVSSSSDQHHSTRTCLQSCGICLRRFFRRFCFCFVLLVWSLSFTATIPLLYTIDSNEKSPKPVYCPGTKQISYLEEWFDRNRFSQTVIFNLIPLLISLLLSIIALLKLLFDWLYYIYFRLKMSKCSPWRKRKSSLSSYQQQVKSNSISLQTPFSINLTTPCEITTLSSNSTMSSCGRCFSRSFLRLLLVLSCCLLACIYPIVMRFYLIYFSVLVPLIFAVLNYSLGQLTSTQQQTTTIENYNTNDTPRLLISRPDTSSNSNINKFLPTKILHEDSSTEQIELQTPLVENFVNESSATLSSSSTTTSSVHQSKRKYFSNHLYENTRNMFIR